MQLEYVMCGDYAISPEGNEGWYMYDAVEGRWIRFLFDFS